MTGPDQLTAKLKKLDVGDSITLRNGAATHTQVQAWYRAARKQGMKVSIRCMPDGVRLYRIL